MVQLESTKLFSGLSETELCLVRQVARELQFRPDQAIFKEGDPGNGIYLVKSGLVQILAIVGEERRVLSRLSGGDLFGEMAVLDNDPRSAAALAENEVTVYYISREDLLQLLEKIPKLPACLVREISRRLRDFNCQYIEETLQSERLSLVGRFARSIVHDLKNPLAIIGMAAELSSLPTATADSRATATKRIRKQVERITNMVNELLEFTRGSHSSFVMVRTDYAAFVNQVVEELRGEVKLKSAQIELENTPPSLQIEANPARLTRVFHNLAHNATDAMSGTGGKITFRFNVVDNRIITEIEDTGPGIAPEIANKLFQAFASYGKTHGTGLGLSICKKIVEDHRGQISTRSEPGHGAIFVFSLPIAADQS